MSLKTLDTRRNYRLLTAILLFTYWAIAFLGTHLPEVELAAPVQHSDKLLHFLAYAGLGVLLCWYKGGANALTWRTAIPVFLVLAAYGFVDEITQYPIQGRSPELADWFADLAGGVSGIALFAFALPMIRAGEPRS